jgi:N utilization substance protein B
VDEPLNPETRQYASSLIEGTIKHITNIEEMVRSKLDKSDLDHIRIMDRTVLYLSVYSLMFCRDVPAKVVINEAVILAKEFGNYNSYKFINGVLDAVSRQSSAV